MTKLNRKLSISICIAVIMVSVVSLTINKLFVHKYYLYEKKKIINKVEYDVKSIDSEKLISNINSIEDKHNVIITYVPISISDQNPQEEITENFTTEFWKKDISLKKFWISKDVLSRLNHESVNKIYNQGKSKYSLLVKFLKKDSYIFAIGTTIEHSQETIEIINRFNVGMSIFSVILITILTFILSNKIIKPIDRLKLLSKDISRLNFRTEEIKTNDEIEELANSINKMSLSLEKAHKELNKRNENLKTFISDASHEMKTPLALIKAYSMGIQDGIDDGTYLDTIIEESEHMTNIINTLLYWAKYEKKEFKLSRFDLEAKVIKSIENYEILIQNNSIDINVKIDKGDFFINADESSIEMVLNNLLSNSIKYNTDSKIDVFLLKEKDEIFLSVVNGCGDISKDKLDDIWKPFNVIDQSRNKEISGTGLGLSIVKEVLDAHSFDYGVELYDNKIEFYVVFNDKKI